MGEKWPIEFSLQFDFHVNCRDFLHGTWDRWLYFPSEGRHAEDFFSPEISEASAGFEPSNLGTRGQHANHWTTSGYDGCSLLESLLLFLYYSTIHPIVCLTTGL
jgi:hypothetical protein